jgi:N-acetylmuramic acid 6-phosphate etherase
MPTRAVVALLLDEDARALRAARAQAGAVARAADAAAGALAAGGRVVFAGAGTSGRLGVVEAAECPPTFGTDPGSVRGVIAGGPSAVFRSRDGAEDRDDHGRREGRRLGTRDLLVGVSASALTPFVRGALAAARARGARTVLVTCAPRPGLRLLADVVVAVPTGPEVLTGSTRLKAGSATKAVLNAITTAAMVRLGKTYENLMVDLRPGSRKLRDRALRIVAWAAGTDPREAGRLLRAAQGSVKAAILMGRLGLDLRAARRRLEAAHGHLRAALSGASAQGRGKRSQARATAPVAASAVRRTTSAAGTSRRAARRGTSDGQARKAPPARTTGTRPSKRS